MNGLTKAQEDFARQFVSSDEPCECAPGDYHEVEASDWRMIHSILRTIAGEE